MAIACFVGMHQGRLVTIFAIGAVVVRCTVPAKMPRVFMVEFALLPAVFVRYSAGL